MTRKDLYVIVALILFLITLAYAIAFAGIVGLPAQKDLRPLGRFYLTYMVNSYVKKFWAASPEGVTAILWDYRGLDTLYETSVFFLAIIGSVAIFRLTREDEKELHKREEEVKDTGLSIIVKLVTRVIFALIIAVSASIALHGHLTPGGGFQGGSALAVAPILLIFAMSRYFVEKLGLKESTALSLRTIGLVTIGIVGLVPLIMGLGTAYFMQNQPKPGSVFTGFPNYVGDVLLGGSLLYYNIAEFLAVGAGFTVVFLLLSIPEDVFKKIIRREGEVAH